MGMSGILSPAVLHPRRTWNEQSWKLVFLSSFAAVASIYALTQPTAVVDPNTPVNSLFANVVGGLLVGFGTKLGNGCTSGHGVCGLARYSKRSFSAVMTFMGSAIATAVLTSSWGGRTLPSRPNVLSTSVSVALAGGCSLYALLATVYAKNCRKTMGAAVAGTLFSAGLAKSGMIWSSKIKGFLDLTGLLHGTWDASLTAVLGSAVFASWLGYQFIEGRSSIFPKKLTLAEPLRVEQFNVPNSTKIDRELLSGAALFGVGWGLSGLCPGPAVFQAAAGIVPTLVEWIPSFLIGSFAAERYRSMKQN